MVGASGLRVSRLGLGTSTWGADTPEEDTATILRNFIDAGGTLIDASPAYAGGRAEGILGTLLSREVSRTDLVISSAARGLLSQASDRFPRQHAQRPGH